MDLSIYEQCIGSHRTYYSIMRCSLTSSPSKNEEQHRRNLQALYPNLILKDNQIRKDKLKQYRESKNNVENETVYLNGNEKSKATKEVSINSNEKDIKPESYSVIAPDWFEESDVDKFEPYHMYVNGRNGLVVYAFLSQDNILTFKSVPDLSGYVDLNESQLKMVASVLSEGLSVNKTLNFDGDLLTGVTISNGIISLMVEDKAREINYSYGLETGVTHWQHLSFDLDSNDEYQLFLKGKDSYKSKFGMVNAEYRLEGANGFELDNFSYYFKPFENSIQAVVSSSSNIGLNDPLGTIQTPNFVRQSKFSGLQVYNMSLFDHDYIVNTSGDGFQVYSKDYAYATVYSNGVFVNKTQLLPGFNKLDDRLLNSGNNNLRIEKEFVDGTIEVENIDYFKATNTSPAQSGGYFKLFVGESDINLDSTILVGMRGTYISEDIGNFTVGANYYTYTNDFSIEAEYGISNTNSNLSVFGAYASNGEKAFGSRFMWKPFSRVTTYGSYYDISNDDCTVESLYLNRNCSKDGNLALSLSLPFGANFNYSFRKLMSESWHSFDNQSNRFTLNKSWSKRGFVLNSYVSYEDSLLKFKGAVNEDSRTKDLSVGINVSYFFGKHSVSSDNSFTNSVIGNSSSHSIGYGFNDGRKNINARAGFSSSSFNNKDYNASASGSVYGDYGSIYMNGFYAGNNVRANVSHEFIAAVNDKSYSLRSVKSFSSDTGAIIDARHIPDGTQLEVSFEGGRGISRYEVTSGRTKFVPLDPGRYNITTQKGRGDDLQGLSAIYANEKSINIFKGDVKTVDFSYIRKILVSFEYNGIDSEEFEIDGCNMNYKSSSAFEFTCSNDRFLDDKYFNSVVNGQSLRCKFSDVESYKGIYYVLKEVDCNEIE
ncbi:hypothetical protein STH12_02469 [Shewanella khirikhana]|uniref:Fimbrial Usher protein n=2 Tax=Shewanella khirikhana TaxID=1965282 RepID=A0ABM7DPF0_9GAMM|nr:hypothetical protein STH12_02469 [Shewanella khirikhana]